MPDVEQCELRSLYVYVKLNVFFFCLNKRTEPMHLEVLIVLSANFYRKKILHLSKIVKLEAIFISQ